MSSYSSRHNRYYESTRGNPRSQSGNPAAAADDESMEGMSEDLKKIYDDDSKCSRLLKKVLRDERSFDLRIQRLQEFQTYLEKSDSNKVIQINLLFSFENFVLVYYEISSTSIESTVRTIPRKVCSSLQRL
jgi:hypothetical protein